MALLHWSNCCEQLLDPTVVYERNPEVQVWPVQRVLWRVCLRPKEATPDSPLNDPSIAHLAVLRVFLQEPVEPVKRALVRHADRKEHLVLPVLWGGRRRPHHVGLRRILHHAALEWQVDVCRRPEVHMHRHALEGDRREERLVSQVLWQGLRLRNSYPIFEEGYCVRVGTCLVQVQHDCNSVLTAELLRDRRALPVEEEVAIRVEADAVL
mmetsp:Transcript_50043/g.138998  ORF Transcript_50043/g.138998 Transcript_50043/m.138998 type:complete len:210 (+) Transcript_50043:691-1320(+)